MSEKYEHDKPYKATLEGQKRYKLVLGVAGSIMSLVFFNKILLNVIDFFYLINS